MEINRVEELAQGRVYSGLGAFNVGLIDGIGGLNDAVKIARELAGIPQGQKNAFHEYPKPKFMDKMLDRMFESAKTQIAAHNEKTPLAFAADLFFPKRLTEDLRFRITNNGKIMPILPLETNIGTR